VKLYMAMGMRRAAVELALKVDPALARELAKVRGSEECSDDRILHSAITNNQLLAASLLAPLFASLIAEHSGT